MSTLKELLQKATPGPWTICVGGFRIFAVNGREGHKLPAVCAHNFRQRNEESAANAALIARCNPQTMALVLEALENSHSAFNGYVHGDESISAATMHDLFLSTSKALNALNSCP